MAYEYARKNHKDRVSIINKANVIKTTDGKFLNICKNIGKEYPEITTDEWYIDITTAKLIDEKRRKDFKVFVLPNLYGDIITDEAAEFKAASARQEVLISEKDMQCSKLYTVLLRV